MIVIGTFEWMVLILIALAGLVSLICPGAMWELWRISSSPWIKSAEPTHLFLISTRISGALFLLFDLIMVLRLCRVLRF